jgi:hypothetical protein
MSGPIRTEDQIALIGAGPSGLAGARALQRQGIAFQGFEAHADLGGLWNIGHPRSTAYASLRMVSSKAATAFTEHPMPADWPDHLGHAQALQYLRDYAARFDLQRHFRFGTLVRRVEPVSEKADSLWRVTVDSGQGPVAADYRGVVIANGIHAEPLVPRFAGRFDGELMHTSAYRDAARFAGKRVLIVGAGNSAADLAVDAAAVAASVDLSVRRGAHLWPRRLDGRPIDDPRPWWQRLPRPLRRRVLNRRLRSVVGDPAALGLPDLPYTADQLPPVISDELPGLLARGDVGVRAEISRMDGRRVLFTDGSHAEFDLVVAATGYRLHYPFLRAELLNWHGTAPRLYLNVFPPHYQRLSVLGMLDGAGLGWRDREAQADLVSRYLAAQAQRPDRAADFERRVRGPLPDLRGGLAAPRLERLAHAVDDRAYRAALRRALASLGG